MARPGTKLWDVQTTTDALATLAGDWKTEDFIEKNIVIRNTAGVNAGTYRILGSVDGGVTFDEIVAATSIAINANDRQAIPDVYTDIRIEIQATVASNQTTMDAQGFGKTR